MEGTPGQDSYLTPLQVAEEMGVTDQTVYNWIRERRLAATRIGRRLRIRRSDLERAIAAHSTTVPDASEDSFWNDPGVQDFQLPGRRGQE